MEKKLTIPVITKMWIAGEKIPVPLNNDKLYKIAKRIKADTSLADRLHGRGFISQELIEQINLKVSAINKTTH